jgi:hypothetical protein
MMRVLSGINRRPSAPPVITSLCLVLLVGMAPASGDDMPRDDDLEKLVAPMALYPDPIVAIVLPAACYPEQIVAAEKLVKDKGGKVTDDDLQGVDWDESVTDLARYPDALEAMATKLDWTKQLGQAFMKDQKGIMAAIQSVRKKAKDAGNLDTNQYQQVTVGDSNTIIVQPADPQVVYVPTYDPTVIYEPASAGYPLFAWGAGFALGAWCCNGCDWHRGYVDVHHNVNINHYHGGRHPNGGYGGGHGWHGRGHQGGHNTPHRGGQGGRPPAGARPRGTMHLNSSGRLNGLGSTGRGLSGGGLGAGRYGGGARQGGFHGRPHGGSLGRSQHASSSWGHSRSHGMFGGYGHGRSSAFHSSHGFHSRGGFGGGHGFGGHRGGFHGGHGRR